MNRALPLAALATAALLVGCGGSSSGTTSTTTSTTSSSSTSTPAGPPPTVKLQQAHPCPTSPTAPGYYMQCKSRAPGQVFRPAATAGAGAAFGIDFAWGGPSGPTARSLGARFGVSYLSGTSKDWTYALAHSYANAGLGVAFVWETTAARTLGGCAAGAYDARAAAGEQARLGFAGAPVFFASDFDTSGFSSRGSVGEYYRCARAQIGGRAGAYGGERTMEIAQANGYPSSRLWQTLAWSYGHRSPACLYQYSIEDNWHGYSVDYNLATCADYGQANFAPRPPPDPYRVYPKKRWALPAGQHASEYYTVKTWDRARCRNPVKRRVCQTTRYHLVLLRDRIDYVARHPLANGRPTYGRFDRGRRRAGLQRRIVQR